MMCNLRLPAGRDCPSQADGDCANDTCALDEHDLSKYVCCLTGSSSLDIMSASYVCEWSGWLF